ncbi:MAG: ISAs1 family transposase [Candidatus Electrothrix sp. AUS1_2]|nr:ISAs1 family transposase [Candidatus Electrothrix sp. AUS1_2]
MIKRHFGIYIERDDNKEWAANDGKTLRGTVKGGDKQSIILSVTHDSRKVTAQARQTGNKSSEINVMRNLLKSSGLERQKVTLDAHHLNPLTTSQIHQAGGRYLIRAKENQPILSDKCRTPETAGELLAENIDHDKANGRMTIRHSGLFSMESLSLDKRRHDSGMKSLTVVKRETFETATGKTTAESPPHLIMSAILQLIEIIHNRWLMKQRGRFAVIGVWKLTTIFVIKLLMRTMSKRNMEIRLKLWEDCKVRQWG